MGNDRLWCSVKSKFSCKIIFASAQVSCVPFSPFQYIRDKLKNVLCPSLTIAIVCCSAHKETRSEKKHEHVCLSENETTKAIGELHDLVAMNKVTIGKGRENESGAEYERI